MTDTAPPNRAPDVKEACVQAAMTTIRDKGPEALNLRDIARRLGVSHQAPYKHFPSKDHLLAEVIRRCLTLFATELRRSGRDADGQPLPPLAAMQALGRAYLAFAAAHPAHYRLMFATPWPAPARDLGLDQDARAAFDVLGDRLAALQPYPDAAARDRDALFVWAAIHGIASVCDSEAMGYLDFDAAQADAAIAHALAMIGRAVHPGADPTSGLPD